jgi:hypothetical protein
MGRPTTLENSNVHAKQNFQRSELEAKKFSKKYNLDAMYLNQYFGGNKWKLSKFTARCNEYSRTLIFIWNNDFLSLIDRNDFN